MTELSVKCEVAPGADIASAISEGVKVRSALPIDVEFDFNGVLVVIQSPHITPEVLQQAVADYHASLSKPFPIVVVRQ